VTETNLENPIETMVYSGTKPKFKLKRYSTHWKGKPGNEIYV
jgi:hypothetical protein